MNKAILWVDYTQGDQSTYKRLMLEDTSDDSNTRLFDTGDAVVDWYNYYKYIYYGGSLRDGFWTIDHSPTVEQFFEDGDEIVQYYYDIDEDGNVKLIPYDEIITTSVTEWNMVYRCVMYGWMKEFDELKQYVKTRLDNFIIVSYIHTVLKQQPME